MHPRRSGFVWWVSNTVKWRCRAGSAFHGRCRLNSDVRDWGRGDAKPERGAPACIIRDCFKYGASRHISRHAGPAQPAREMQLEITRNDAIGAFIYTLIDKKSGEIVRQWPTEQMVKMREYFAERGLQMLDKNI